MTRLKDELSVLKSQKQRERLLRVLVAATFLIFFQAYMVAPLIPHLSEEFKVSGQTIGLIVPGHPGMAISPKAKFFYRSSI